MDESTNETISESEGRPRGILTQADREYLKGQKELAESSERNTRQRIRERIKAGLADFELLWTCLSDRDLELVFYPENEDTHQNIRAHSHHAIAFIQLGLWKNRDPHPERISDAIEQAAYAADLAADVEIDLKSEKLPDGDLLLAKIRASNKRINTLRKRIIQEDFGDTTKEELEQELQKEKSINFHLFERALTDKKINPEMLESLRYIGFEHELTAEDVKKERQGWNESPIVRRPMPIIVDTATETEYKANQQSSSEEEQ